MEPGSGPTKKVVRDEGVIGAVKLKVVLEESPEGGYTVYVPSLPGCISEGDTREEALANIEEAIALYLEPVEDDILTGEGIQVEEITV